MSPKIFLPTKRPAKWALASRLRKKQRDEIQVEPKKNLVPVEDNETDSQGERSERKEQKRRSSKRRPSWERVDRAKDSSKVPKQQECLSPDFPSSSPRGLPNKEDPEPSNPSPLQKLLAKLTPAKRYPRPWEKKESPQSSKKHCIGSVPSADGSDQSKEDASKGARLKPSHEVSGAANPANHDVAVYSSPTEVHGHTAKVANVSLPFAAHNSQKDVSTCETPTQKTRDQLQIPRKPLLKSPPPPPTLLEKSQSEKETKNSEITPREALRMSAISFKPRSLGDTDDGIQQDIHSSFQIPVSPPTNKKTTGLKDMAASGDSVVLTPRRQPSTPSVTPSPQPRSRRVIDSDTESGLIVDSESMIPKVGIIITAPHTTWNRRSAKEILTRRSPSEKRYGRPAPTGGHLPEDAKTANKRRFPRFSSLITFTLVLAVACHVYKFVLLRGNSGGWKYMDATRVIESSLLVDETRKGMNQEQDTSTWQLALAGHWAQIPAAFKEEFLESSKAGEEQESDEHESIKDSEKIVFSLAAELAEIPERRALMTTKIRSIISGASSVSREMFSALEENIELKEQIETAQMLMTDSQPPAMDVDNRQTSGDDTLHPPQDIARKEDCRTDEPKSTAASSSVIKQFSSTEVEDNVAPAISRISAVVSPYFRNEDTNKERALDHSEASSSKEQAISHEINATHGGDPEDIIEKKQDTESAPPRTIVAGTGESMKCELVEQEHSGAMKDAVKGTTSTLKQHFPKRISEVFTPWIPSQKNRKMTQEAATIWRRLYAGKGPTSNPEYSNQGRNHLTKSQGTRKRSPKSATRRTQVFSDINMGMEDVDEGGRSGEKSAIDDTGDSFERTSYGREMPELSNQSRLLVGPVRRLFAGPVPLVSPPVEMPSVSWDEETRAKGNAPVPLHKNSSNLIEWGRHLTVHLVRSLYKLFNSIGRLLVFVYHHHPFNLLVLKR
jgi:hypothetical protein